MDSAPLRPVAACIPILSAFSLLLLLATPHPAEGRRWLPSMPGADPRQSSCFNEYAAGGTRLAQCGAPTASQIATREGGDVTEFISIQDHSVLLVDHDGNESQWSSHFSGFSSTNWQTDAVFAQAYTSYVGSPSSTNMRSNLALGYTSYFVKGSDVDIGDNQFYVTSPSTIYYYLPGCPNFEVGQTSQGQNHVCPRRSTTQGEYKFTVVGLLQGTKVNSLNSASPPSTTDSGWDNNVDRDIGDFRTLIYRTTLDLGAMGASVRTFVVGGTEDGKSFENVSATADLANSTLHIVGERGEIQIGFSPTYSTGTYTRNYDDVVSAFGSIPCQMTDNQDQCTRDLTGFDSAPDSFPEGANPNVQKLGNSGTSRRDLARMAGAPELKVTEVKNMKITMRKSSGCSNRPASPAAHNPNGLNGLSWPNAPADCPWWYLATQSSNEWAVDDRAAGGMPAGTILQDDMLLCESDSCYLVDFHIQLGGETEASRTVFGNPANAVQRGWETGTFFMYDPKVFTGAGPNEGLPTWAIVLIALGSFMAVSLFVGLAIRRSRNKRSAAATGEPKPTRPDHHAL